MRKVLSIVLLINWMIIILLFSQQSGTESADLSSGVVGMVLAMLEFLMPAYQFDVDLISVIVRKSAHFFLYFVLGILTLNFANEYSIYQKKERIIFSILFCILFATIDEIQQIFIPGRHGGIDDVLIDAFGSVSGILLFYKIKLFKK